MVLNIILKIFTEIFVFQTDEDISSHDKTPKNKGENKVKQPVMKLEGGIEYQDVIIGRGPVAANGKVVCNFHTFI